MAPRVRDGVRLPVWWVLAGMALTVAGVPGSAEGQCTCTDLHQILASDGAGNDFFGSVSLHGTLAVIGANGDARGASLGSAYVYRWRGGRWNFEEKLLPADADGDQFGLVTSVYGEVAVVGAPRDDTIALDSGAAYVFRFDGARWAEEQKLVPADGTFAGNFGTGVSLGDDVLIVGAPGDESFTGSAYVYRFDGVQWTLEEKLVASDRRVGDSFGHSVAIDADVAIVGATTDNDTSYFGGTAYAFRHDGTQWRQEHEFTPGVGDRAFFGSSSSLSGDVAVIGAPGFALGEGAAFVFRYTGFRWEQEQRLHPADLTRDAWFGLSVSLDGDLAIVGAGLDDAVGIDSGSAYVYRDTGSGWVQTRKLLAGDGVDGDAFGSFVAISGPVALVGAVWDDALGTDSGSAYVLRMRDLALETSSHLVSAGDTLTLTTCGGQPGAPGLLAISNIDGTKGFVVVRGGRFDSDGILVVRGTVPPGLAGLEVTFFSAGFYQAGSIGLSNFQVVRFR